MIYWYSGIIGVDAQEIGFFAYLCSKKLAMALLDQIRQNPQDIAFSDVISYIDAQYEFSPTRFTNGGAVNEAGENNGSCKILFFAKIQGLDEDTTLNLFGDYYRKEVLGNPSGTDHQNIRNFMQHGWDGVSFDGTPLK